jgi:hypothetical protein
MDIIEIALIFMIGLMPFVKFYLDVKEIDRLKSKVFEESTNNK